MIDYKTFSIDKLIKFFDHARKVWILYLFIPMYAFFDWMFWLIHECESYMNTLIESSAIESTTSFSVGTFVGIANHFVPVDLIFERSMHLLHIWAILLIYRFCKSWIPTLS